VDDDLRRTLDGLAADQRATAANVARLADEQANTTARMWEVLGTATTAAGAAQAQIESSKTATDELKAEFRPITDAWAEHIAAKTLVQQRRAAMLKPTVFIPLVVLALAAALTWGGYLTWSRVSFDVPGVLQPAPEEHPG